MTKTTLILAARPDGLHVQESATSRPPWNRAARLLCRSVPQTMTEDRPFIDELAAPDIAGVCLTQVKRPADIEKASALLRVVAAERQIEEADLVIIARLDTVEAALGLAAFNHPIPRLAAFLFDQAALACAAGVAHQADLIADLRLRLPLAAKSSAAVAILTTAGPVDDRLVEDAAGNGYEGFCLIDSQ